MKKSVNKKKGTDDFEHFGNIFHSFMSDFQSNLTKKPHVEFIIDALNSLGRESALLISKLSLLS